MENISFEFTKEDRNYIKSKLMDCITDLLPKVIEEITPLIIQKSKSIISNTIDNHITTCPSKTSEEENITTCTSKTIEEENIVKDIITENRHRWNSLLDKREDLYFKHSRCESLLDLYTEGLQEEPMYIPRKFRNDKMHIRSNKEVNIVSKLNLQHLQAEMKILKIRKDDFHSKIQSIEDDFKEEIETISDTPNICTKLKSLWQKKVILDVKRVDGKWKKKKDDMRNSFRTDKLRISPSNTFKSDEDDFEIDVTNSKHSTSPISSSSVESRNSNPPTPSAKSKNLNPPTPNVKNRYPLRSTTSQN